mgnify:CR=1 FL=1
MQSFIPVRLEILQHSQIVSMISFRMSTVFISVIRPITPRSLVRILSSPASGPIKEAVMTGHGSSSKIALFGTAGYAAPDYIHSILKQAEANIPVNNTVLTGFVCQGKMQPTVADKFAAMLEKDPEDAKAKLLRDTYNEGLSHPNEEDFANFKKWAEGFIH